jgi:perosamine synthetase
MDSLSRKMMLCRGRTDGLIEPQDDAVPRGRTGRFRHPGGQAPVEIPLSSPDITAADREAVLAVLHTRHLALGPRLREFEQKVAASHGRRHAIAVNSGTAGLHLAVLALGLEAGDEVITTPFSFVASANCILYAGATPRFVDIDPRGWNLDPDRLAEALTPRTRGILPVHVFGVPCDMARLRSFAREHGLWIVEDACEAIGARISGEVVGRQGDLSVLAFYPNKQITTGEGGLILTDDDRLAATCRSLRNQGRGEGGGWLEHERLGYNYRMSDIAAALGTAQLARLDEILQRRAEVARQYLRRLGSCEWLRFQHVPAGGVQSWFVFVVVLADHFGRQDRDALLQGLTARGIGCSNYFPPIHLQPYMRERFDLAPGAFPLCERLSERTLALPFHTNLSEGEIDFVCRTLLELLNERIPATGLTAEQH